VDGEVEAEGWSVEMKPPDVPRQNDAYNCGVILLLFALRLICKLDVAGVRTTVPDLDKARLLLAEGFIDGKSPKDIALSLGWQLN
jgi:hypothetical protein